jgi:hypothetical protein
MLTARHGTAGPEHAERILEQHTPQEPQADGGLRGVHRARPVPPVLVDGVAEQAVLDGHVEFRCGCPDGRVEADHDLAGGVVVDGEVLLERLDGATGW